ncbi:alpha/beta hydrolase family protein [Streptomyces sp. 142MFCol3.1]|uniref:alpha/beta hydrolase family protein n=1 Tax=Streptomyces sp. 142MFCol3.1 TaxID=1172179 RepID=UPI00048D5109|nr:dienelactone hydrolase family protein [Streptomyces sp. 142MFCol3.1]
MNGSVRAARALACAGVLVLSACGGGGDEGEDADAGGTAASPSESAASPSESAANDFGCLAGKQLKKSTTFEDTEGNEVDGYETGTGTTGIVLSHQSNNDVCSWIPSADELAAAGYRVLAVNSNSSEIPEIEAAAARLREDGARKVVLMGASKGGTASLVAASRIRPAVTAVVSLSGPGVYGDMDATKAVPELTMPVYLLAASGDGRFADDARTLHKLAKKSHGEKLEMVAGAAHGSDILLQQPSVWDEVKNFIKNHG